MPIDPNQEELVSLTEAARLLPRRRGGKKAHCSCLYRWSTSGCKDVILETIQIGGTRCTSREALARFFEKLTKTSNPTGHRAASSERCTQHRKRAAEKASRQLIEEGC